MWQPRGSTQRHTEWNSVQRRWQDPLPVRHWLCPGRTFTSHLCDQRSQRVSVGLPSANLQRWECFITEYELLIILTECDDCCCQLFLPAVQCDYGVEYMMISWIYFRVRRNLKWAGEIGLFWPLVFWFPRIVNCILMADGCVIGWLVFTTDVVKSGKCLHQLYTFICNLMGWNDCNHVNEAD